MWHVFIRPLIEPCLLFNIVNTETKNDKMISWARSTFKSMCGLVKTTKNDIVELLMGLDIEKLSKKKIERAEWKWKARVKYEEYQNEANEEEDYSTLEYVPDEIIKTLNIINKTYCSKCSGQRITPLHLEDNHNIILPHYDFEKELRNLINLKKATRKQKSI